MELPIKILLEDNPKCTPYAMLHDLFPHYIIPPNCYAFNCDPARTCASRQEFRKRHIFTNVSPLEARIAKLRSGGKDGDIFLFFFGYHCDVPVDIRKFLFGLLTTVQPEDNISIIVSTNNVEKHDHAFYRLFAHHLLTLSPERKHYCSRCRQPRTAVYATHSWYEMNKQVAYEERCDTCKHLRNKDLPDGGLRHEYCDCRHAEDIAISCITCRAKVADYVIWDETAPNENAMVTHKTKDDFDVTDQYVYCSLECRQIGRSGKHHPHTCWVCQKPGKACGNCEQIHYCSIECQKSDWDRHKVGCRLYCNK